MYIEGVEQLMRNRAYAFTSMLLAGIFLFTMTFSVFAADRTTQVGMYLEKGENQNLKFKDGAGNRFSFDNVLPGDTLTQNITIENRRNEKVAVYFKASSIDNTALMEQIELTIVSGGVYLYQGSLSGKVASIYGDQVAVNTKGIPLGTCAPYSYHYVTAELKIPITLDNDYAEAVGNVTWAFYAEYDGTTSSSSGSSNGMNSGGGGSGSSYRPGGGTNQRDKDPERTTAQITDGDVPLAGDLYTVTDNQTPLIDLPKTGGRRR